VFTKAKRMELVVLLRTILITGFVRLLGRESGSLVVGGKTFGATAMARRVEPRFENTSQNNSLVVATIGNTVTLPCRVFMKQGATVSWSVQRESTMDLLTVGNTTFTGDQRISVHLLNPTNWALVIKKVQPLDAGRYLCTLETFPKQSLVFLLQVNGPVLEILNSSVGFVYSVGSYLSIECMYRNRSMAPAPPTTPHPLFPVQQQWSLPTSTLAWTHNNRTFSLRNRKRVRAIWTGSSVVSTLSIKSAIQEDSGNYSCLLPSSPHTATATLQILKAEHSSELKPETGGGAIPLLSSLVILVSCILVTLTHFHFHPVSLSSSLLILVACLTLSQIFLIAIPSHPVAHNVRRQDILPSFL